ncbi:fimbria/pilus outer membrane usher protein [Cronobacter dublinensis]|uniref:fimbria/pilus outer membrane usher protein n=1 Tax=Cronobacter dublinensis TaxID=413497 RepID=UPI00029BBBD0|nr:fimbria/pilus outer membrane usher protein [Cronobacter dublinensis]MDI6440683.1 fimbria/pilus outer membrane usher protein [Cronobacter dublinensis]NCH94581.1 fimbrial biogenesis outer membrane usher protein [Cronobacter dublinensis]CCJ88050.1 type 1 fimbriae anchoring protein FimD [Cronobacter dublinensis 582]
MSSNTVRVKRKWRARHLALCISLQCLALGFSTGLAWGDDYFNPALLDEGGNQQEKADLSLYEKGPGLAPGKYRVDIFVNNQKTDTREVNFVLDKDNRGNAILSPCLSIATLKEFGVATEKFSDLAEQNGCANLSAIPAASAQFLINQQRLLLSIPQTAINQMPRGAIAQEELDEGITVLLLNYSYSSNMTASREPGHADSQSDYLNLRPGFNIGPWRLRNYSTWSRSNSDEGSTEDFSSVYTYLQRDFTALNGEFVVGQSSSPADVFDSVPFTGAQLASDDDMLPDSQRGYAPVVHGIANSNAQVTIRQNGYVIYQNNVAAGAFEITDLYSTGSSGDLNVTVKETDGSEQHFIVPYASVPVLQREGHLKYSLTGGKYRSYDDHIIETPFVQGSLIYGLPAGFTAYGGIQYSAGYEALALGIGKNLGDWGAFSVDVTSAQSQPFENDTQKGRSWRVRYSKDILSTGTTLTVAGYRYNTADFYTLQEILDSYRTDNQWSIPDRRRSREEMTINQSLGDTLGSLNLNLVKEQYWNEAQNRVSVGAGYNNSWHGISFGLNYSLNQNTQALYDGSATKSREQVFSLNVSLPLDQWLSNTWASYSMNNSQEGNAQTVSLNGSALAGNNLNWGLQWSPDSSNNAHATSLNADYRGTYGELSTGYSQDKYQRQLNYSVSGGVVAHRNGITLGQPLGETIALVKAPGSSGTAIANQNGINTDFRGYALVPYVSPWRRNTVALNTATLPDGTDVTHAAQTVTPTRGAVVRANFDTRTGSRALITLLRAGGQPVPFGASVTDRDQDGEFIVGDGGQVFVTGLTTTGTLTVSWGNNASKHCHARYHVPENTQASPVISFTAQCS